MDHRPQEEVSLPGQPLSIKTQILDMGACLTQSFKPIENICTHLLSFNFYNGDMGRQSTAHYFCINLNEDIQQCLIYDSNSENAKLVGIEYIISDNLFKTLPEEEKRYWHTHVYEVKSGVMVAPLVPDMAEKEFMKKLVSTYGKSFKIWQVDRGDPLPLGPPQLMMSFTADGQISPSLHKVRDQSCNVSVSESKNNRSDIPIQTSDPLSDHWRTGIAYQIKPVGVKNVYINN